MSITEERVPHIKAVEPDRSSRSNRVLIAVIAVLGLALAGLGAWVIYDQTSDSDDPQLETVTELVDGLHEGLNERDLDKVSSVFKEDAVVNDTRVPTAFAEASVLSDFERVSEVTELGEFDPGTDYYIFVQQFVNVNSGDLMRAPMLIELDGDLLSQAEWVPDFFYLTD